MKLLFIALIAMAMGVKTYGNPVEVGKKAPDFQLHDVDGKLIALSDYKGKIVVLEWVNEGCPFSRGHYLSGNMQSLQQEYTAKGVIWLTINSTHPAHPEAFDAAESKAKLAEWHAHSTANLMDPTGIAGHLYDAKSTPDMFVIDAQGILRYRGAIDDDRSTDGGKHATINYVRAALDAILSGKEVAVATTTSYGCSVKYQ